MFLKRVYFKPISNRKAARWIGALVLCAAVLGELCCAPVATSDGLTRKALTYAGNRSETPEQSRLLRWALLGASLAVVALSLQTVRLRRARVSAEAARREATESQQRFDTFMTHTPAIAIVRDDKGRFVYVNQAYCEQFATTPEKVLGKRNADLWPREIAAELEEHDREILKRQQSREYLECVPDRDGGVRTLLSLKFPFVNPAGQRFLGAVSLDITDRKRTEEALRFSQFSIDRSPDMVFWLDAEGKIIYCNRAACRKLGFDAEELQGMSILQIDPTLTEDRFRINRSELKERGSMSMESLYRKRDGFTFPVEISMNHLEFDGQEFSCTMSRDITDRKRVEEELFQHARYDALTGLINRRLFERKLDQSVLEARETGEELAIFYMDLDRFKLVNDTLGHSAGDALLKQVAERLQTCVRTGDTLARMGGDEFTLISRNLKNADEAGLIGRKLLSCMEPPVQLANHELRATASIGVSRFPGDGQDGSSLLQSADAAMYEAKHKGKNQLQFFTQQIREAARERMDIEQHLRHALERNEFELHYQPQVCLATGEVERFEALLRWKHPEMDNVPSSTILAVAEETLRIVPIGKWMLEQACREARKWRSAGVTAGVGLNISRIQFANADFYEMVRSTLEETKLDARLLQLELKETVLTDGLDEVAETIQKLRLLGVSLALDEFGTGHSSLSYLRTAAFDAMKLEASFARGAAEDATGLSVARALVSLAQSLNMRVLMEGIETPGQLEAVRKAGSDCAQGNFLGLPARVVTEAKLNAGIPIGNREGRDYQAMY